MRASMLVITPRFSRVAQHGEAGGLVAGDACKANEKLEGPGQARQRRTDRCPHQLGIDVIGIQLQDAVFVVPGLVGQAEAGTEIALDHGQVGALEAARPAAGKERVKVVGILAHAPVGLANGLVGQAEDAVARLRDLRGWRGGR